MSCLASMADFRVLMLKSKRVARNAADITDGGTAHVYHLSQALAQAGAHVHIVSRSEPDDEPDVETNPLVTTVSTSRSARATILDRDAEDGAAYATAIPRHLWTRGWSVIHIHHWTSAVGILDKLADVPVVYTPHLLAYEKAQLLGVPLPPHIAATEYEVLHRADHIVCLSLDESTAIARHYGVGGDHVHVIPNGGLAPVPSGAAFTTPQLNRIQIVTVGRLVRQKGYDVLLDALKTLDSRVRDQIAVHIVGPSYDEPIFEAELRMRSMDLDVPINFVGAVAPSDLVGILCAADIYVQPSRYESQGIALQEAMRAGLPVVATQLSAITEYATDEENSLLVRPEDPVHLASAIERLVRDPMLRTKLGGRALTDASAMRTWESSIADNIRVLATAASSRSGRPRR